MMTFCQKLLYQLNEMKNAGGMDNVPPAPCPRSAHASACVAAYVERTGRAEAKEILCEQSVRPAEKNRLVLRGGYA
jgi:hypothetical protein